MRRFEPYAYAALRFMAGVLFLMHGTRKLWGWPGDRPPSTATLAVIGGWIEVVTGILIATGILASWAAFLASGMMAVAYFLRHADDGFFPLVNRGELAVVYCFLFLYIAARDRGWRSARAGDELTSSDGGEPA